MYTAVGSPETGCITVCCTCNPSLLRKLNFVIRLLKGNKLFYKKVIKHLKRMKAALKKVIMCFYSINKFVFKLQQDINYE